MTLGGATCNKLVAVVGKSQQCGTGLSPAAINSQKTTKLTKHREYEGECDEDEDGEASRRLYRIVGAPLMPTRCRLAETAIHALKKQRDVTTDAFLSSEGLLYAVAREGHGDGDWMGVGRGCEDMLDCPVHSRPTTTSHLAQG